MSKPVERRVFSGFKMEKRKVGEKETVMLKGLASPFGKESEDMGFREVIQKGAFARALGKTDTIALFNHDPNFVLGRKSSNTLALREIEEGLEADIEPPDTQLVRDMVLVPVERGDIKGMSIGFTVAKGGDMWEERKDGTVLRTIKEIDELFDVSVVTYPAYPDTTIAKRSMNEWLESSKKDQEGDKASSSESELAAKDRDRELQIKTNILKGVC